MAWSLKGDPVTAPLASSKAAATRKWTDYNDALQRCVDHANAERVVLGQRPLQPGSHFVEAYNFVPFAIERDWAWGSEAHQAFESIVEAAQAGVDAEAFHWSAMNFERHWRQRVAVALGRGQALIVTQAAERAHPSVSQLVDSPASTVNTMRGKVGAGWGLALSSAVQSGITYD